MIVRTHSLYLSGTFLSTHNHFLQSVWHGNLTWIIKQVNELGSLEKPYRWSVIHWTVTFSRSIHRLELEALRCLICCMPLPSKCRPKCVHRERNRWLSNKNLLMDLDVDSNEIIVANQIGWPPKICIHCHFKKFLWSYPICWLYVDKRKAIHWGSP